MKLIAPLLLSFVCIVSSLSAQVITGIRAHQNVKGAVVLRYADDNPYPQYIQLADPQPQVFSGASDWLIKELDLPAQTTFSVLTDDTDRYGNRHLRLQQFVGGREVRAGQYVLHGRGANWTHANGELFLTPTTEPTVLLSPSQAIGLALDDLPAEVYGWETEPALADYPEARLVWVPADLQFNQREAQLAYAVKVYAAQPLAHQTIYLSVTDGSRIATEEHIHSREAHPGEHPTSTVPGIAVTAYAGQRSVETTQVGDDFRLQDATRGQGIATYNCEQGGHAYIEFEDADNFWDNANEQRDEVAGDIHWGTAAYFDYLTGLGRNSIDNNGELLQSHVHYDIQYANAFWDGTRMTYGDGSPFSTISLPLASIDVVAHEITHGLTERTSGLIYNGESGALNESFSDIFGAILNFHDNPDQATWLVGAYFTTNQAGIRSMEDPNIHGDPDTYGGNLWNDFNGVHTNSGVQNHWFQLITDGETGVNDLGHSYNLSPISIDTTAEIAYHNNAFYLTPSSNYADAGFNAALAAINLYGACSVYPGRVVSAWRAVGVEVTGIEVTTANFSTDLENYCDPQSTVQFINASSGEFYYWDFGDGTTSTETMPSHVYGQEGTFEVTLTVASTNCGSDTITDQVTQTVIIDSEAPLCSAYFLDSDQTVTNCNGVLFDSGGPDENYQVNENHTFTIISPSGGQIALDVNFFETENNWDQLRIYDGEGNGNPLIQTLSGVVPFTSFQSSGDALTVVFTSDGVVTRPGFELEWNVIGSNEDADASFTVSDDVAFVNQEVFFASEVNSNSQLYYDFGDGTPPVTGNGPVGHRFETAGSYTILAIDDNCMVQDSATAEITILEGGTITYSPESICDTLLIGSVATHPITIANTGTTTGFAQAEVVEIGEVSAESSIEFFESNETTVHDFELEYAIEGQLSARFLVFGDFDGFNESASVFLEGNELGEVGNGENPNGSGFELLVELSPAEYIAAAADGILSFSLTNSSGVDLFGEMLHRVEITYEPASFIVLNDLLVGEEIGVGQSRIFDIDLNAIGLLPGLYESTIRLFTSDSLNPTADIPVKLKVIGVPDAEYSTNLIDFGELFTNEATSRELTIFSIGTDSLYVNEVVFPDPLLSTATTFPLALQLNQDSTIMIDFLGTPAAGVYNGQFTLNTNAGTESIFYFAEVIDGPVAEVSPDSICVTIDAGTVLDTFIRVSNATGLATLEYQLTNNYQSEVSTLEYEGGGGQTEHLLENVPALTDMTLNIVLQGDFRFSDQFVSVVVNGIDLGVILDNDLFDDEPDTLRVPISPEMLNDANTLLVEITNSSSVFASTFLENTHTVFISEGESLEWINLIDNPAILSAGSTVNYPLGLDATELIAGEYITNILFVSNDPLLRDKVIPVKLNVIGAPELLVDPTTVDFGELPLTTTAERVVRIENTGTDDLAIESLLLGSSQYSIDQFSVVLAPGSFVDVNLIFAPSFAGNHDTELTISGPTHNLVVPIFGSATEVPQTNYTPEVICVELATQQTTSELVTITNLGQGALNYELGLGGLGNRVLVFAINPNQNSLDNILEVLESSELPLDVSVIMSDDLEEFVDHLEETDILVLPATNFISSTIEQMYGAIIEPWMNSGGTVISAGNNSGDLPIDMGITEGSFITSVSSFDVLTTVAPDHPLLTDITLPLEEGTDDISNVVNNFPGPEIEPLVTVNDEDDELAVYLEEKGNGLFVYLGYEYFNLTDQNEQLLLNAIDLTISELPLPQWLTVSNGSGTVASGGETTVGLTFNSGQLPGGDYEFLLSFATNEPGQPFLFVDLKMTILTVPEVIFSVNNPISCDPTVLFTDLSTQNPTSWTWEFGDGSTSSAQNPTHTYPGPGVYDVSLTACNEQGCNTQTSQNFVIVDPNNPNCSVTVFEDDGDVELTGCQGVLRTLNHPGNYENNMFSEITITSQSNEPLRLTVNAFLLESCCDDVRIYDGGNSSAPLIGIYNGTDLEPGDEILSTGSQLYLVFDTDGSATYSGFEIEWACVSALEDVGINVDNEPNCPASRRFSATGGLEEYAYTWDFGDGVTATGPGVHAHTYPGPGNYLATLLVQHNGESVTLEHSANISSVNHQLAINGPDTVFVNENATFIAETFAPLNDFYWASPETNPGEGETFTANWPTPGTYLLRLDAEADGICSAAVDKEVVVRLGTGFGERSNEGYELLIFPNPTADQLQLRVNNFPPGNYRYQILDAFGRIVIAGLLDSASGDWSRSIDVSALPAASYTFSVSRETTGQRIAVRTFVKR